MSHAQALCLDCTLHFSAVVTLADALLGVFPGPAIGWSHAASHLGVRGWSQ